ncbi:hypothetical protein [Dyadobacter sp. CY323]|uniref:hypothetical protein n=1 Tax=Dyadobacter sp. CY323 TaxID=2907302 RepID=UPI001F44D698|nr:hypothetical protein [Dyadobacter sp. CY323]MCE6987461.1 hypothetical protein [Dyadobacter sp. CY323]
MVKLPIGAVIKELVLDRRIKAVDIAQKLGLSRAAIYQSYAKFDMSNSEIERWASVLGVTSDYILERRATALQEIGGRVPEGDNYLLEHLTRLEESFKEVFKELRAELDHKNRELEVKNQQMAGLQKTVDVLLGKSEDVMILMTSLAQSKQPLSAVATA